MELKYLIQAKEPLEKLFNYGYLPIKITYKLSKLFSLCQEEFNNCDKIKTNLIKKHGTIKENGDCVVDANTEAMQNFISEYEELLNQNVDISEFEIVLSIDKIVEIDETLSIEKRLNLSANDWVNISNIIKIE